jgi:hypothetical protein
VFVFLIVDDGGSRDAEIRVARLQLGRNCTRLRYRLEYNAIDRRPAQRGGKIWKALEHDRVVRAAAHKPVRATANRTALIVGFDEIRGRHLLEQMLRQNHE